MKNWFMPSTVQDHAIEGALCLFYICNDTSGFCIYTVQICKCSDNYCNKHAYIKFDLVYWFYVKVNDITVL